MEHLQRAVEAFSPGARLVSATPLEGGISATMFRLQVDLDGEVVTWVSRRPGPYRVRQNPDAAAAEFRLLSGLRALGLPCPRPLFVAAGEAEPFCLLEFVEGRPVLDPEDPLDYARKVAEQLARIHTADPSGLELEVNDTVYGEPKPEPNEALRESEIRAAVAAYEPRRRRNPNRLLHGDPWPGNIIWNLGDISGVIDWEEACLGDPLFDLGIARLDLLWITSFEAMEIFTDHYVGLTGIDTTDLAYWDLVISLRPIRHLSFWASSYPHHGRPDIDEAYMGRVHQEFVARAFERLR